jgi:hypothetical protein
VTETGKLEVRQVRPKDIRIPKRYLTPGRDNTALIVDMMENGQEEPVVVVNGTVIDGVRRAEIARVWEKRGSEKVHLNVVYPQTGDQLLHAIPSWKEKGKLGYSWSERPFDFVHVYNTMVLMYQQDAINSGERIAFTERIREYMKVHKTFIYHTRVLLKEFASGKDPGTPYFREKLVDVANGRLGPQQFLNQYRNHALVGDITGAGPQRAAITSMLGALSGISSSIKTLGPLAKDLSAEEVTAWIKQLRIEEKMIRGVIRSLERAKDER